MTEKLLNAEKRTETGKSKVNALRKKGLIPAVFYAHKKKPVPITINEKDLKNILSQEHSIISLKLETGKKYKSILREIQYDPVKDTILHVDFMGIKLKEKIKAEVPVTLTGTPVGVKEGGIIEQLIREVEIEALPLDIPDHIEVDVSHLKIGDSVHAGDIKLEKIKVLTKNDTSIATVGAPRKIKEVEEKIEKEAEEVEKETPKEEEK
ncbi:50S ribosomal protein L25 [candidate division KSB1 bacterium]|nr:MAG: 50S ribosomal protein L25 [candidate division KSB1 bacterium]